MAETFELQSGYGFKRPEKGGWSDAEIVVVPERAVGARRVMYRVIIDGALCVVFATPVGFFAQTEVACRRPA